jgi:metal-sulfur cluster biosynthetic enzyme
LLPDTPPASPARVNDFPSDAAIWEALRQVIDPELGLNIVDLGLIREVQVAGTQLEVRMTVTTPGCPMEQSLTFGIETVLLSLEGVTGVQVEVVHQPPWTPDRMTPEGRQALGIRG